MLSTTERLLPSLRPPTLYFSPGLPRRAIGKSARGVRQLVYVDYIILRLAHKIAANDRSDEAGASSDDNLHGSRSRQPPLFRYWLSRGGQTRQSTLVGLVGFWSI